MALTQAPMPVRNPMVEDDGFISRPWRTWLRSRSDVVNVTPIRVGTVGLGNQSASIPPTVVPVVVTAGLYRVSIYARRTVVATTSSGLGVIIWFTEGGQSLSVATPVNTENTLTAVVMGSWVIRIDPDSFISYEVAYGSVNPGEMKYNLDVVVEQVQA